MQATNVHYTTAQAHSTYGYKRVAGLASTTGKQHALHTAYNAIDSSDNQSNALLQRPKPIETQQFFSQSLKKSWLVVKL